MQFGYQFQKSTGIRLYPLFDQMLTDPVAVVDDFVYPLEVTGSPGVKLNMKDGLRSNLLLAHRMLSTREMVFERLVAENQTLAESPPLPFNESNSVPC